VSEHRGDRGDKDDPSSYACWQRRGFRGRPPWGRGYRWRYLAVSLGLMAFILAQLFVLRLSA